MKLFSLKMLQQALSLLFFILYFMLSLLSFSTANPNIYVQCSELNFTSTTPYESNVNSLFNSFVDSASQYNFNKFETSPKSDVVYGLYHCRGDLSSSNCKDCVANAVSQLKSVCPTSTCGDIQLEGCFVKYEDTSFFGVEDKMEVYRRCGPSIGYDYNVLNRIDDALADLVGGNSQYFRGGDFESIQSVAQCVQDLSLSDCHDCLSEASGRLRSECETSSWGDMYLGKCYIQYADQDNSNLDDDNDDCNSHKRRGKGRNNDDCNSHKRRGKGRKINYVNWIGSFIGAFFGGAVTIGVAFKCNCCNMNVYKTTINILKEEKKKAIEEAALAKAEAKLANERANEAEEAAKEKVEGKEARKPNIWERLTTSPHGPYMPMSPPRPYLPHSSLNTCYYL